MTTATGIDLLTPALAAGRGLSAHRLSDLGAAVEHYVAEVGVDELLATIPPGTERAQLAQLDGGPLLALRRCAADERSTIHSHAWTVLVELEGEAVFELEARYGEGPDQRMARQMHHLVRDPEGITEHVLFSTGVWPAARVATQAAQAPMVRS